MTEKEVIMEVLGFFIIPYRPKKDEPLYYEPIEDEQELFQKILNFRLVSQREDERQYELKNKIERLEFLKQKMIEFDIASTRNHAFLLCWENFKNTYHEEYHIFLQELKYFLGTNLSYFSRI